MVCAAQVSQVDQVRRDSLDCQGLQESLVKMVDLVSNKVNCLSHQILMH